MVCSKCKDDKLTIEPAPLPIALKFNDVPALRGKVVEDCMDVIWQDEWFLRRLLMKIRAPKRNIIIAEPGLNKTDRYVLNVYLKLKDGEKVTVNKIIGLVKNYYGIEYSKDQVKYIRQKAYNIRRGVDFCSEGLKKRVNNGMEVSNT